MDTIAQAQSKPWKVIRAPLIYQAITWMVSSFVADFGFLNTWITCAILTYWSVVLPMVIFRRARMSRIDAAFIRWGFPFITMIYLIFGDRIYLAVEELLHRI
jgi:hypothetical protein